MKYSDASVRPLSSVMKNRRGVVPDRPDRKRRRAARPSTSAQNHFQTLLTRRLRPARSGASGFQAPWRTAVLHDREQLRLVLQDRDVGQRVAVHQQQVGEPAVPDLAQLLAFIMICPPQRVAGNDGLHRRHAEVFDEVLEVLGVLAVRRPGEAVVAAGQHADAALEHRLHAVHGGLELDLVAHVLGDLVGDADHLAFVQQADDHRQARARRRSCPSAPPACRAPPRRRSWRGR